MKVHPTARGSTTLLRLLADKGPLTVEEALTALGKPSADKDAVATMLRNFRNRGRVVSHDRGTTIGRPARWSITPEARRALEAGPAPRKPRKARPARAWELRRPAPRPLKPSTARYCRWFLAAGWGVRETARLFGLKPRDLEPLRKADDLEG